ncbi:MAG: hypothetical protein R3F33_16745 [Planctomycetota bacterium]
MAVAAEGDWLFVGTVGSLYPGLPQGCGIVDAYRRGPGGWSFFQTITTPNPFAGQGLTEFGLSITDGVLVLKDAYYPDQFLPEGRVCTVEFNGQSWVNSGIVVCPPLASQFAAFGTEVAYNEGELIVGAAGWGGTQDGGFFFFGQSGGAWGLEDVYTPPSPSGPASLLAGEIFSVDGDRLVYASRLYQRLTFLRRNTLGVWGVEQILEPFPIFFNDTNWEIKLDGDTLVLGLDDTGSYLMPGLVHVFRESGGVWSLLQTIYSPDISGGFNLFGHSIDLEGDRLLVGDPEAMMGSPAAGGAYLYSRNAAGTFDLEFRLESSNRVLGDSFGEAVALERDFALIGEPGGAGAPGYSHGEGAGLIFYLPMGDTVCPGVQNSTGNPSGLELLGTRIASEGQLYLRATDLPAGQPCLFLAAQAPGFWQNPSGSMGNLCLSGPIARFLGPSYFGVAGANGRRQIEVDLGAIPYQPSVPILAGQTWYFQAWYRDWVGQATSNFTPAVTLAFE